MAETKTSPERKPRAKAKKESKSGVTAALIILIALLAIGYLNREQLFPNQPLPEPDPPKSISDIVAVVNGQPISHSLIEFKRDFYLSQLGASPPEDALLNETINEILLLQEAEAQGYGLEQEELNELISQWIAAIKGDRTDEEFAQQLAQDGLTMEELQTRTAYIFNTQIPVARLINATLFSEITVTEEEIRSYYDQNPDLFIAGEGRVRIRHILVEQKTKATNIREDILEGLSTWENSSIGFTLDTTTATNYGELGFLSSGDFPPAFEEAAFNLNVGDISEPIKTQLGWHLIQRMNDNIPFELVKNDLRETILLEKQQRTLFTFIDQIKSRASITYGAPKTPLVEKTEPILESTALEQDCDTKARLYVTSTCRSCTSVKDEFITTITAQGLEAHVWELDTGDDLLTIQKEAGIPREEGKIFETNSPDGTIPLVLLGCAATSPS